MRFAFMRSVGCVATVVWMLSACASQAVNSWVKPGALKPVECLAVSYSFGPFTSAPANSQAEALATYMEQQVGPLLQYNAIPFCGLQRASQGKPAPGKASHLLRLTSKSGEFNYQAQSTSFNVDFELVELASNEVVFRGATYGWVQPRYGVSKMLSRSMNSMNDVGLVAIPGGRLKYAVPEQVGNVITD